MVRSGRARCLLSLIVAKLRFHSLTGVLSANACLQQLRSARSLVLRNSSPRLVTRTYRGSGVKRIEVMKTYHVTSELAGFTRERIFLRVLLGAGAFAVVDMLFRAPWSSSTHLLWDFSRAAISGVIFALVFVLLGLKRSLTYDVLVSDDCITAAHPWFERSVRKDEVKSVWETHGNAFIAPALRISKYGRFGTWFWGGIWIPKALPGYEVIRDLALSWKVR